ncbi:hypothetical protein PILCRDRAFT_730420 [Piloderma croceum F 1598]|uniref:Uncharacterized protein n=1 Tax=Piloderma croceum (strain F 1598) TaxID=765440 RepID=A0A0C3B7M9_PILCF|nr:hypothetical protein PILCRDRAFT_730420 [Piloderma croceum F 1598]
MARPQTGIPSIKEPKQTLLTAGTRDGNWLLIAGVCDERSELGAGSIPLRFPRPHHP